MNKLDLPVGESAFKNIREWDFYYVDKTPHIYKLARKPGYYFLSRPRRFGKTLLVDTMQELFEGNEQLFRGLHIHDRWDWTVSNPVVRLSFDTNYSEPGGLEIHMASQLSALEEDAGIELLTSDTPGDIRFQNLVRKINRKTRKQVVILVDEYDKPILDVLDNKKQAEANRDYLHGVYGSIKGCARYIRFVFVTGISMYSKVSLFSGLNNLNDISLDPRYATICGYTDSDIDTVFAPELEGLDRDEIRRWYNGYSWLGEEKVYNPFDVLLLFDNRQFEPYWYETGTPKYLYKMMAKGLINTLNLENLEMEKKHLSNFNVDRVRINSLLFQSGYLTIKKHEFRNDKPYYTLEFPNHEVRLSLNEELLDVISEDVEELEKRASNMVRFLAANDFGKFEAELHSFFCAIPNQWYVKSGMQHYEGFYAGMVFACFIAIGVDVKGEESTSRGRSDLVVVHAGQVFVLEFKVAKQPDDKAKVEEEAFKSVAQIREKKYVSKYRHRWKDIHLLGVVFDGKERNVTMIRAERD